MTQIFFPSSSDIQQPKIYGYVNEFTQVVIAKINGLKNRQCERVIFPAEKFLFMANDNCKLEIFQKTDIGIIKDTIACSQLKLMNN